MDASNWIAGAAVLVAALSGFLAYRSSKSATSVNEDANHVQWVKQARADAAQAQQRAAEAVAEAEAAERRADACQDRLRRMELRMVDLESRARYIEARAGYIVRMIHDPYMSIDMLRERVPADFAVGGDAA